MTLGSSTVRSSQSIALAIAGAWGYIGRKFLEAARILGVRTAVYDPGPAPPDLDWTDLIQFHDEQEFYRQDARLFHLALHPGQRRYGLNSLLERSRLIAGASPSARPADRASTRVSASASLPPWKPWILCEKPMALPEEPDRCREIVESVDRTGAVVLYDFPELYDPITRRVCEYLAGFQNVTIQSCHVQRSKDREDRTKERNYKVMVSIQYQETVHCLAFVLHILSVLMGELDAVFVDGLSVRADSEFYHPPNPAAYPHMIDGKCDYQLILGPTRIEGHTNFLRGANWTKRRVLRGRGDGKSFVIDMEFLEGRKQLTINGEPQMDVVHTNSYAEVIRCCNHWQTALQDSTILSGCYPNAAFARVTYQLSSLLWWCGWHQRPLAIGSLDRLLDFDAGYAETAAKMPDYR